MTSADLGETLAAEGWRHSPDTGRDTWYNITPDGEIIRVRWRNPAFTVRLTAQAPDSSDLHWEATLCHASEPMLLRAARAALTVDDDPPLISRLPQEDWVVCPLRDLDANPLASFSYGTEDGGRYVELRVVADEREQVRPTVYAEGPDGARIYTEPNCPAGVVAAVALG